MDYDGHDLSVRATGGDSYLGGANFDKVLFDYFVEQFRSAHGLDINDPRALSLEECTQVSQDWLMRATRVKHDLTARERTTAHLQAAGLTLRVEVRRETFLERSRVLLDEITEKILSVVAEAGVRPKDIGVVLAVGGSTRIPAVRARMQDVFGVPPDTSVRPDEAVALGAALFAAQRQLERGGSPVMEHGARAYLERLTVTDVAAHTVGVSVIDPRIDSRGRPVMAPMLPRNTALPFGAECSFFTIRPSETRIVVPILEGEDSDPALCRRVGEVIVDGLPPGRPAHQQVVVTMRLDRDGILQVSATDVATGAAAATTIVHADQNGPDDDAADRAVRSVTVE
jgi:molecular chaperone DnaK